MPRIFATAHMAWVCMGAMYCRVHVLYVFQSQLHYNVLMGVSARCGHSYTLHLYTAPCYMRIRLYSHIPGARTAVCKLDCTLCYVCACVNLRVSGVFTPSSASFRSAHCTLFLRKFPYEQNARALGSSTPRRDGPRVCVELILVCNCAALETHQRANAHGL